MIHHLFFTKFYDILIHGSTFLKGYSHVLILEDIYPISENLEGITSLQPYFDEEEMGLVTVAYAGRPIMAILLWMLCESRMEAPNVVEDCECMETIYRGTQELIEAQNSAWKEVLRTLN